MKFEIGQKVLCLDDHFSTYCAYPVKKGSIYTINGFYECACGSHQVNLIEFQPVIKMRCKCQRTIYRRQSFYSWRFIPLDYFDGFITFSDNKQEAITEMGVSEVEYSEEVLN